MIQTFIDWLVNIITVLGYPGVFLAVFIESFFAPIPSEIILPFSGFVASNGDMNIYILILVATVAAYLGSLPFYMIGRWGEEFFRNFLTKYGKYLFIDQDDVEKAFNLFDRYGNGVVFLGRLIPIVRTLISFPAGIAKMNFIKFTLYTLMGSLVWNILLSYTGYILGDNWESVGLWVKEYEGVIIVVLIVIFLIYIGRGFFKRIRKGK